MNLLPGPYQQRLAARRIRQCWAIAAGLCALLAVGAVVLSMTKAAPEEGHAYTKQIAAAQAQAQRSKQEATELGARLAQNRLALSAIDVVAGEPDWRALLDLVSGELGDNTLLTECRFGGGNLPNIRNAVGRESPGADSAWLILGGVVASYPEVPAMLLRLEEVGLFEQVLLVETRAQAFAGQSRIGFRIACRVD